MKKLTDAACQAEKPRATQYSVGDAACPGLCLRITPKGVKTFAFAYRNKATRKVTWLTIGRYPDVPLARAREIANDARKAVANGETPVTPKDRLAATEKAAMTYAKVVELYDDAHLATLRTGRNIRTTLQRIGRVYRWNDRPIASITDDEAALVLADIAERRGKKRMANQAKHLLHGMFKWAKQPGRKFVTLIKPTSTSCPSAWQPNPGRRSTYRRGETVQTTGTTSEYGGRARHPQA